MGGVIGSDIQNTFNFYQMKPLYSFYDNFRFGLLGQGRFKMQAGHGPQLTLGAKTLNWPLKQVKVRFILFRHSTAYQLESIKVMK